VKRYTVYDLYCQRQSRKIVGFGTKIRIVASPKHLIITAAEALKKAPSYLLGKEFNALIQETLTKFGTLSEFPSSPA